MEVWVSLRLGQGLPMGLALEGLAVFWRENMLGTSWSLLGVALGSFIKIFIRVPAWCRVGYIIHRPWPLSYVEAEVLETGGNCDLQQLIVPVMGQSRVSCHQLNLQALRTHPPWPSRCTDPLGGLPLETTGIAGHRWYLNGNSSTEFTARIYRYSGPPMAPRWKLIHRGYR